MFKIQEITVIYKVWLYFFVQNLFTKNNFAKQKNNHIKNTKNGGNMENYRTLKKEEHKNVREKKILYAVSELIVNHDDFYANYHLACKDDKNSTLRPYGAITNKQVATTKRIKESILDNALYKKDIYITSNGIKYGKKRKKSNIFTYNNIVIDLDCHDSRWTKTESDSEMFKERMDFIVNFIREMSECGELLIPSLISKTGRGIQLWYTLEPLSYKCKFAYEFLRDEIINQVECLFDNYRNHLSPLKLDYKTSRNDAGFYRIPGTYNTKARCWGEYIIENEDKIDALDYYFINYEPKTTKGQSYIISNKDYIRIYLNRKSALIKYIELQNKEGIKEGYRNNLLFIFYNNARCAGLDHTEAMSETLSTNELFLSPLSEREVRNLVKSSNLKQYKFSNRTILKILDISKKEEKIIGLFDRETKSERKTRIQKQKNQRNEKIIALYKQGRTQTEISIILGTSQPTVCRVLKAYKTPNQIKKNSNQIKKQENISASKHLETIPKSNKYKKEKISLYQKELNSVSVDNQKKSFIRKIIKSEPVCRLESIPIPFICYAIKYQNNFLKKAKASGG